MHEYKTAQHCSVQASSHGSSIKLKGCGVHSHSPVLTCCCMYSPQVPLHSRNMTNWPIHMLLAYASCSAANATLLQTGVGAQAAIA